MKQIGNFNVPESYDDITITQFTRLTELSSLQGIKANMRLLSILVDGGEHDDSYFDNSPFDVVVDMIGSFGFLSDTPSTKPIPEINHNGTTYKLREIKDFKTKEFIDFDELLKKSTDNLPLISALLYRRENELKDYVDELNYKAEQFKTLPVSYVYGAVGFLLALSQQSLSLIDRYSDNLTEEQKMTLNDSKMKITAFLDGVGN